MSVVPTVSNHMSCIDAKVQLHVYEVSPVLTTIEKTTSHALAMLFGLKGPFAGGVSQPGGSAANFTALVVARNTLFPSTKSDGYDGRKFIILVSANAHYSLEKAAQICGFGSSNIWSIPVDPQGCLRVSELEVLIRKARDQDLNPFFVCATAGTTVLGAYDPLPAIAEVCKRENLWFHVDASWGGAVVFSTNHRNKMAGSEHADSLTFNPHKMLGVPLTCSFLLTSDLRKFKEANSMPAGYLFHQVDSLIRDDPDHDYWGENFYRSQDQINHANSSNMFDMTSSPSQKEERKQTHPSTHPISNNTAKKCAASGIGPLDDIGDLTLQCGRKGDSLKLFLSWLYYGTSYYGRRIDEAFSNAAYLASLVATHPQLELVSECPPPCLQVCCYYAANRIFEEVYKENGKTGAESPERNTWVTKTIAKGLVDRGFMVDYAPGERGMFLRVVVHLNVKRKTIDKLIKEIVSVGDLVIEEYVLTHQ